MNLKNINKKSFGIVAGCVVLVLATGIYVKKAPKKKGMGPGGFGGKGGFGPVETVVSVKTRPAAVTVLHDFVNTNGEIESQSSIDVFPDIGGKVHRTFVDLGSRVAKGDVIAEVDPNEPGLHYAVSQIYAPVAGTITKSLLEPGTKVSTQSVITTIGDVSNLQIKAKVVERYVAFLKPGLKAKITLEAYPDEVFDATVDRVSPVIDKTSRTKEVVLRFDRVDGRINAGMFAKVTLFTVDYDDKITVPSTCIVQKGSHEYVFVVSDDGQTAVKKEIKTGHVVENEVQVEGIEPGQLVVVEGMSVLTDGSKIRDLNNPKVKNDEVQPEEKKDGPVDVNVSGKKSGKKSGGR